MKKVFQTLTSGKPTLEGVQRRVVARATARIIPYDPSITPARARRANGVVVGSADDMTFFRLAIEKTNNQSWIPTSDVKILQRIDFFSVSCARSPRAK